MADGAQQVALRYSAFISYSRKDAAFARRLHRRLEGYRLPRHLADAPKAHRLKPLFRDEDELCASYDLSTAVREAIAQSEFLIVVCSPHAAASKWVGLEVEYFRASHSTSRSLTALVDGSSETAFHPALRGGRKVTPLAADFRKGCPQRLALLKLIAPMAGVRLDELAQRDAHRQTRRVTTAASGAVVIVSALAGLSLAAMNAKRDADLQRDKAQGLVTYAISDLGKDLRQAGRLDLLETTSTEALSYYEGQDVSQLSDEAQGKRAELLQSAGGDDLTRGNHARARPRLAEARRSTSALLAKHPNDARWIFAHAQSEYWIGLLKLRTGDNDGARAGFEAYATLAQRLVAIDPGNFDWRHEVAYSELNLGMLALRQRGDAVEGERRFQAALGMLRSLAGQRPGDPDLQREVADALAWLADSQRVQRHLTAAWTNRLAERAILDDLAKRQPRNVQVRIDALGNELAMARIEMANGAALASIDRLEQAQLAAEKLKITNPENAELARQSRVLELFKVRSQLNLPPRQRPPLTTLSAPLANCAPERAPGANAELAGLCTVLRARMAAAHGDHQAIRRARRALDPAIQYGVYSPLWGLNFSEELAAGETGLAQRGN